MPSLVQEIPHNLEMAKAMSQRVSLLVFPCEPGLSEAQLQLRGAPLLAGPRGGCGWQLLLRWWLSELLPGLKEATSKDAATTTDKWNQKALPQPRRFLSTFHQSPSFKVCSSEWIWAIWGAFLPGSPLQVQTHPSVLGMWGDNEFCLKGKEMGLLP